MSEKPILYSTPMIKAILTCARCGKISVNFPCSFCGSEDFRKTVTRRVIKPQPNKSCEESFYWDGVPKNPQAQIGWYFVVPGRNEYRKSPYQVGDLLWVREGWRCTGGGSDRNIIYRAEGDTALSYCGIDDGRKSILRVPKEYWDKWDYYVYVSNIACAWRPSIHMPKWAARIWLEVLSVRPERFQQITEEDCLLEGIETTRESAIKAHKNKTTPLRYEMQQLWDSLNTKRGYPWDTNPWVWRIEFKRSEK